MLRLTRPSILEHLIMVVCAEICRIKKKNSVVLSPLANYTDRAIAVGQRS
jgi:hypothetical protein